MSLGDHFMKSPKYLHRYLKAVDLGDISTQLLITESKINTLNQIFNLICIKKVLSQTSLYE